MSKDVVVIFIAISSILFLIALVSNNSVRAHSRRNLSTTAAEYEPFTLGESVLTPVSSPPNKEYFHSPVSEDTLKWGDLKDSEVIDLFGQANASPEQNGCVAGGMTNSSGYVCLTPELVKLLTTRGGNATGK
jgi:hypothetical protein